MTKVPDAKRSTASSVLSSGSKASKLRTELRRVMSDRVLKITRCSQQQNVIKKDNLLNNTSILPPNRMSLASQTQLPNEQSSKFKTAPLSQNKSLLIDRLKSPESGLVKPVQLEGKLSNSQLISKETSPKFLNKLTGHTTTNISPNARLANKISLQPIKTFDLKDKKSLSDHIITSYNDVINSNGSIVFTVQSIINSITHYIEANKLELKSSVDEILKEYLFKSTIDLKQKYIDDELSEKLKVEGQLQVLLQIENYVIANQGPSGKVKVDDDWVWDIANSIRWLKQKFKDFKIEKFLFGEIYANYYINATDFISSLMEELGYDGNEDNGNESSDEEVPKKSPTKLVNSQQQIISGADVKNISSSAKFLSQLSHSQGVNPQLSSILKEDSNSSFSLIGGVNSLFEEEERTNTCDGVDHNDNDETTFQPNNEKADILDEFIKKKPVRFTDSKQSTVNRSIVIQKKQRTKLKIRSPFKSPSKGFQKRHENRRSPRIKDKQILQNDSTSQKRPRTYLITDTPDHKQNTTIITTRQEKLRKRFSFQQFNCASSPSVLPVVPDTPVKGDTKDMSSSSAALFPFQKIYPSPSKAYLSPQKIYASPQKIYKTPQKTQICGSPFKVYATPSPSKNKPVSLISPSSKFLSPQQNFVSPAKNKSPAKRVIFR